MKLKKYISRTLPILLFLVPVLLKAQGAPKKMLRDRLKDHIVYLADDKLQGRESGTEGEMMAAEYIAGQFGNAGLKPGGNRNGFFQEFEFYMERKIDESSSLEIVPFVSSSGISSKPVQAGTEADWWKPAPLSADGSVVGRLMNLGGGVYAPDQGRNDYHKKAIKSHAGNDIFKSQKKSLGKLSPKTLSGKVFMIDLGIQPEDPHSALASYFSVAERVKAAEKFGAQAVVLFSSDPDIKYNPDFARKYSRANIPVIWVADAEKLNAGDNITLTVKLEDEFATARNVIGVADFGKPTTIVIGAHYDHLGMGEHGGSLHRGEPGIHNGADDNASGVAMMIELARWFASREPQHNFVFIAFSGEEKGLLGSNYYVKQPLADLEHVHAMINMDMVGRLDKNKNTLIINGVGTSPAWNPILESANAAGMKLKTSESGVGPSDHTSFYLKDVPVLHVFSGTHGDYHRPSDDEDKINYEGMGKIYYFLVDVLEDLDGRKEIEFTKTKEDNNENAPRFTVTLGVVPDYAYDGTGMRIDGVTEGKTASVAGMKAGDVVVKMGEHEVEDMMGYMRALSRFKKGDETEVEILRDGKPKTYKVKFQ